MTNNIPLQMTAGFHDGSTVIWILFLDDGCVYVCVGCNPDVSEIITVTIFKSDCPLSPADIYASCRWPMLSRAPIEDRRWLV